MNKSLIVIAGPTAVGKTELAISIAKKFQTEVISADSRQIYKELQIGVARPSQTQLSQVKHHFIANKSVKEEYTAGKFEKDALDSLKQILDKNDTAVMVGGSGLYIKGVCEGLDAVPTGNLEIRERLENELKDKGLAYMQDALKKVDPMYHQSADIKNPRRVLRALEVFRASGKAFSSFHKKEKVVRDFGIIKIGITPGREELYKRINQRAEEMMKSGLLEEVRDLTSLQDFNALQTVGYKELFAHLRGDMSLETAVNLIKQNTRNYAKRQLTWFRKDKEINWFEPGLLDEILKYISLHFR